jgi:hypothetical protein
VNISIPLALPFFPSPPRVIHKSPFCKMSLMQLAIQSVATNQMQD